MKSILSATGTASLLAELSPHIPDEFINDLLPRTPRRGRRLTFSLAQFWRVHLLALLTPVHSFNLLVHLLGEQKAWRQFAHLSHRHRVPDVWMLNQFRDRIGVKGLRHINEHLLKSLIPKGIVGFKSVALIDATDLEASSSGHKKRGLGNARQKELLWVYELSKLGRAVSSWVTKSTHFDCGSKGMNAVCCWYLW